MTKYNYVSVRLNFNLSYTGFEDDFIEELTDFVSDRLDAAIQVAKGALNAKLVIVLDLPLGKDYTYNTDGFELASSAVNFCISNGVDLVTDLESVKISFCSDELDED